MKYSCISRRIDLDMNLVNYKKLIEHKFESFQLKLYHTVIDDVIAGVRDSFLDEGVDEQVLQEMKQVWTNKLMASKAVEAHIEPAESLPPPIVTNNTPKSKVCICFARYLLFNLISYANSYASLVAKRNKIKETECTTRE